MSQITFTAKFLSFEEYLGRYPDVKLQEVTCEDCGGSGWSTCFHCGHDKECDTCGGSKKSVSARDLYQRQLRRDKEVVRKYQEWLTRDAEQAVGPAGADHSEEEGSKPAVKSRNFGGGR